MMSRNGEAHDAFYGARDHGGMEQKDHPLMMWMRPTQMEKVMGEGSPESQARLKKTMGRTDAHAGGWAGHMPGPMDPFSNMAGETARAWESGSNWGEIDPRPITVTEPKKRFTGKKVQRRSEEDD